MSYLTKEEYMAAVGGYGFLLTAAKKLAEDYQNEFVGAKWSYLEDIDIDCDEITGDIDLTYSVSYCGCCPDGCETYTIPIDYLWDDDWVSREKERREQRRKIREAEEAKKREAEAEKLKERRYQQYLNMKKEFEGED